MQRNFSPESVILFLMAWWAWTLPTFCITEDFIEVVFDLLRLHLGTDHPISHLSGLKWAVVPTIVFNRHKRLGHMVWEVLSMRLALGKGPLLFFLLLWLNIILEDMLADDLLVVKLWDHFDALFPFLLPT